MKWTTIKNRCVREAYTQLNQPVFNDINMVVVGALIERNYIKKYDTTIGRSIQKEVVDAVILAIDNWDIRCWKHLQNLFPKAFPNQVSGIELGDNGWVIC